MIVVEALGAEEYQGEDHEDGDGDHFLDYLQLDQGERAAKILEAYPVGWNHKTIFEKCDSPADHYNSEKPPLREKCVCLEFQLAIPSQSHEAVGNNQQQDCKQCLAHNTSIKNKAQIYQRNCLDVNLILDPGSSASGL